MMRMYLCALALFTLVASSAAQHQHYSSDVPAGNRAPLLDNIGKLRFPVTTKNAIAQRLFNQGLTMLYGFNHLEAERSFAHAGSLDPHLAMAWWGQALALSANINDPVTAERVQRAYENIQHAVKLRRYASPHERAFIDALATRYSPDPKAERPPLDRAYANAMAAVVKRYPRDPDALTLYADALMNLMPWDYYQPNGEPKPDTKILLSALTRARSIAPRHPGAHHLYIHAVEANKPELAVGSAETLENLVPTAGHLVHMPSHIYVRVGRWADASRVNEKAVQADEGYLTQCRARGFYPVSYYPHNYHMLAFASMMEGRRAASLDAGRKTAARIPEARVKDVPPWGNIFFAVPIFTLVRFGEWEAILNEPKPDDHFKFTQAMWHYARGMAYTRLNQSKEAAAERIALETMRNDATLKEYQAGGNLAPKLMELAALVLDGEVAASVRDYDKAIAHLQKAVALQDSFTYNEPPDWYYPVRQSLGQVLLDAGKSAEAEQVYRQDLKHNIANGWSLYGLAAALRAQNKYGEAAKVEEQFQQAWARADIKLTASRY